MAQESGPWLAVGYQNIYRGAACTPVRVLLRNGGSADVSGTLEIPQAGQSASVGARPAFHGLYQSLVIVPAGGTKVVTLHVLGSGVQGQMNVSFREGTTVVAHASTSPIGVDTSALLIGVLAVAPTDVAWVAPVHSGEHRYSRGSQRRHEDTQRHNSRPSGEMKPSWGARPT